MRANRLFSKDEKIRKAEQISLAVFSCTFILSLIELIFKPIGSNIAIVIGVICLASSIINLVPILCKLYLNYSGKGESVEKVDTNKESDSTD